MQELPSIRSQYELFIVLKTGALPILVMFGVTLMLCAAQTATRTCGGAWPRFDFVAGIVLGTLLPPWPAHERSQRAHARALPWAAFCYTGVVAYVWGVQSYLLPLASAPSPALGPNFPFDPRGFSLTFAISCVPIWFFGGTLVASLYAALRYLCQQQLLQRLGSDEAAAVGDEADTYSKSGGYALTTDPTLTAGLLQKSAGPDDNSDL